MTQMIRKTIPTLDSIFLIKNKFHYKWNRFIYFRNIYKEKIQLKIKLDFFFIRHLLFSKKCSQICSHSNDLYCYTLKLKISRIALKSIFEHQLMSNEYLFNFFKNNVFTKFWRVFFQFQTVWVVTFVLLSKVKTFTRFFVFKCNIYAHNCSFLTFLLFLFSVFYLAAFVVAFK